MRQINVSADDRPLGRVPKAKSKPTAKRKTTSKRKSTSFSIGAEISKLIKILASGLHSLTQLFAKSGKKPQKKSVRASTRRRGAQPWGRVALIGCGVLGVSLAVGYVGYLIVTNDVVEKTADWVTEKRLAALGGVGLVVQEVSVVGRERTHIDKLMAALDVTRGTSIVDFDPEAARKRIEMLGWVEHASVMRRYPDEIFVRLVERRPFARWQSHSKTMVIDRKGVVISKRDLAEFSHLPKVVGFGANDKAAELFDLLAKSPALFTRLQNAVRVRDRRWNLEFSNGVKVLLPEEGSAHAWAQLEKLQANKKILNKGVVAIDLRNGDRMFVKLRPADAEFRRDAYNKSETRS